MNNWALGEIERRLSNMVKVATISDVDHDTQTLRVMEGGFHSDWLPWPADMGKNYRAWRPLRAGQQVVIICPDGYLTNAVIVGMLYQNELPTPETSDLNDQMLFDDGTVLHYDSGLHELRADLGSSKIVMDRDKIKLESNGSSIELDAAGIRLNGARIDFN